MVRMVAYQRQPSEGRVVLQPSARGLVADAYAGVAVPATAKRFVFVPFPGIDIRPPSPYNNGRINNHRFIVLL